MIVSPVLHFSQMLPKTKSERRLFGGCALAALALAGALALGGLWALLRWYSPPVFAGGMLTSQRTHLYLRGNPVLRRVRPAIVLNVLPLCASSQTRHAFSDPSGR